LAFPGFGGPHDQGCGCQGGGLMSQQARLVAGEQVVPGGGVHGEEGPQLAALEGVGQHAKKHPQQALAALHLCLLPHPGGRKSEGKRQSETCVRFGDLLFLLFRVSSPFLFFPFQFVGVILVSSIFPSFSFLLSRFFLMQRCCLDMVRGGVKRDNMQPASF